MKKIFITFGFLLLLTTVLPQPLDFGNANNQKKALRSEDQTYYYFETVNPEIRNPQGELPNNVAAQNKISQNNALRTVDNEASYQYFENISPAVRSNPDINLSPALQNTKNIVANVPARLPHNDQIQNKENNLPIELANNAQNRDVQNEEAENAAFQNNQNKNDVINTLNNQNLSAESSNNVEVQNEVPKNNKPQNNAVRSNDHDNKQYHYFETGGQVLKRNTKTAELPDTKVLQDGEQRINAPQDNLQIDAINNLDVLKLSSNVENQNKVPKTNEPQNLASRRDHDQLLYQYFDNINQSVKSNPENNSPNGISTTVIPEYSNTIKEGKEKLPKEQFNSKVAQNDSSKNSLQSKAAFSRSNDNREDYAYYEPHPKNNLMRSGNQDSKENKNKKDRKVINLLDDELFPPHKSVRSTYVINIKDGDSRAHIINIHDDSSEENDPSSIEPIRPQNSVLEQFHISPPKQKPIAEERTRLLEKYMNRVPHLLNNAKDYRISQFLNNIQNRPFRLNRQPSEERTNLLEEYRNRVPHLLNNAKDYRILHFLNNIQNRPFRLNRQPSEERTHLLEEYRNRVPHLLNNAKDYRILHFLNNIQNRPFRLNRQPSEERTRLLEEYKNRVPHLLNNAKDYRISHFLNYVQNRPFRLNRQPSEDRIRLLEEYVNRVPHLLNDAEIRVPHLLNNAQHHPYLLNRQPNRYKSYSNMKQLEKLEKIVEDYKNEHDVAQIKERLRKQHRKLHALLKILRRLRGPTRYQVGIDKSKNYLRQGNHSLFIQQMLTHLHKIRTPQIPIRSFDENARPSDEYIKALLRGHIKNSYKERATSKSDENSISIVSNSASKSEEINSIEKDESTSNTASEPNSSISKESVESNNKSKSLPSIESISNSV